MCRVHTYFRVLYLGGCKHSLLFWWQGTSRLHPLRDCFFAFFWQGLVRKSIIWALLIFLHSRTFQARFGVWSLLLPARRVLRASERVWERVQIGKLFHRWKHISELWVTLFRGVKTFIFISMCRVHKYFRILYLGESKHSFFILMSRVNKYFRTLYLGECKHSFLFWCQGWTNISEHFI